MNMDTELQHKLDVLALQRKCMRDVDLALAGEPCFLFSNNKVSTRAAAASSSSRRGRRARSGRHRRGAARSRSSSRGSSNSSRSRRSSTTSSSSSTSTRYLNLSTNSQGSSSSGTTDTTTTTTNTMTTTTTTHALPSVGVMRMSAESRRAQKRAAADTCHKQALAVAWYNRLRPSRYARRQANEERKA